MGFKNRTRYDFAERKTSASRIIYRTQIVPGFSEESLLSDLVYSISATIKHIERKKDPVSIPIVYLSVSEVAKLLGVSASNVSAYRLPAPDALIGKTRGWKEETIRRWMSSRPGSGRWGRNDPRLSRLDAK